jgi:hypothetical protein
MSTGRQADGRSEGRIDKSDCKNRRTVPPHVEVETLFARLVDGGEMLRILRKWIGLYCSQLASFGATV